MTITYSLDVANTRFCGFTKLLLRWKGSIYKILWKELLVFIVAYSILSFTYRCHLNDEQKRIFEKVTIYCETFIDLIPLSFVLGFYVSLVVGRWWNQFDAIPWPDRTCLLIATIVHGSDERSRTIRRTLGRYLILLQMFTFQAVSTAVKKRFPTADHVQAAGLMTNEERTIYEKVDVPYGKWWLPAHWFCALAMRAKKEGRIKDSILLESLLRELLTYRSTCGTMFSYDWISVPLVYTQVVTLATYTYSLALLMGRQYLDPARGFPNHKVDLYVPVFTLLQFFFYVGWLKVAEQIVNPYGEDDDDFELNWCLDRNAQVVYLLVDHLHTKHPKLRRDHFWDELEPQLPHTKLSASNVINPQLGSAYNMEIDLAEAEFLPLETLLEEDNEANQYSSDSVKQGSSIRRRPSILMNMMQAAGFSFRRRSSRKRKSFSESSLGHVNPVFNAMHDKPLPSTYSPAHSRTSSVTTKPNSPAHSRTSSFSLRHPSIQRHKHKLYDLQLHQQEGVVQSGILPDVDSGRVTPVSIQPTPPPVNFEEALNSNPFFAQGLKEEQSSTDSKDEPCTPKIMECYMPPIPEEPSRPSSTAELDACVAEEKTENFDDVHGLVVEANKVLDELNKIVTEQSRRNRSEMHGYESCCSMSSDSSVEDTDRNEEDVKEAMTQTCVVLIDNNEEEKKKETDDISRTLSDTQTLDHQGKKTEAGV